MCGYLLGGDLGVLSGGLRRDSGAGGGVLGFPYMVCFSDGAMAGACRTFLANAASVGNETW